MSVVDFLIRGGRVIDGTGSPWRRADLAVAEGEIKAIGVNLSDRNARQVIDARGMYVTPGFVDAHSHVDLTLLADRWMEHRIMQGITTEVVGQDGLSYAPASPEHLAQWRRYLRGLNGDFPDRVSWSWGSTAELLEEYQGRVSNAVHLIPHGAVRVEVMGWENRPARPDELRQMSDLVRRSLDEGAAGLSTGLTYIPNAHATTEEMIALCRPVGEVGGLLSIHLRSYAGKLLEAIEEAVTMGRESGAAIQLSHLRMADRSTWGMADEVLALIDRAREEGVDVTYDIYPYTLGCAPLFALLPPWAQAGGPDAILERLDDPGKRTQIRVDWQAWDLDWSIYRLSNAPHPPYQSREGQSLTAIARDLEEDVLGMILDLLLETGLNATIVAGGGSEEDNLKMLTHPAGMIGSDGVMVGGRPHPRGYGTYPRLLTAYVRDNPVLRLEEAVHKMTALPARRHNLNRRGVLSVGAAADVVVFSLDEMEDRSSLQNGRRLPKGVDTVLVNGQPAALHGEYLGGGHGRPLRPFRRGKGGHDDLRS